MTAAFFTLHDDLPREGPGEAADVAWACARAGTPAGARILDAGCGPGADIPALLAAAPAGHVTAVDTHAPFVARVAAAHDGDARVAAKLADMLALAGPFDLIWSAGAVYFHGMRTALSAWRGALAPGGAVAFSEPCRFGATPDEAVRTFWEGYDAGTEGNIRAEVAAAGFRVLDTRRLSDAAWEAYYTPMEARVAALRPGADADLAAVLDEGAAEIAGWRALRRATGYLLVVAVPE